MKRPRNKIIQRIIKGVGRPDPTTAIRLFVEPHRRLGDTLESIAHRLGVSEIVEERLPFEGGIFDDSGCLTIKINSLSPRARQRFTLAHEIGHLILAKVLKGKTQCSGDKELEQACDAIAAELLMPANEAASFVTERGAPSPELLREFSRKFDVSLHTAALRVHMDLKLWPQSIGLWGFRGKAQGRRSSPPYADDDYPDEVWFVGKRRWVTKQPPFGAFYHALSSSESVRCRETYIEGSAMKPIAFEVLHVGYQRLLAVVE
jgi:Zn-dependent peptidase ImmA (M78 family)